MKICSKRKTKKTINEFHKDIRSKSGLTSSCKDCAKTYTKTNKENKKEYDSVYRQNNKEKRKTYERKQLENNPTFRVKKNLRSRLRHALMGNYKSGSAVSDLGCSISELKEHLEKQFQSGMTWDNWSIDGWHINHIIPLDNYDLSDREQFLKACYYTNLRPLWAKENLSKGKKIIK